MFSLLPGRLGRYGAVLVALLLLSVPVLAHEGHDHGAAQAAPAAPANPRVAMSSDIYEAVAVLRGDRLTVYLDRFGSNDPVTDAKLVVTLGGEGEIPADLGADATYVVASPKLAGSGPLEILLAVTGPAGDDLLIGTLNRPEAAAPAMAAPTAVRKLVLAGTEIPLPYVVAGVALALGFLLGLAVRARGRMLPVAGVALVLVIASTAFALAHEGEDHGQAATPRATAGVPPSGDRPERLSDGSVFLPKPSQRVLDVRTVLTKASTAERSTSLIGRVAADPNRSGLVQSINGGRVGAPEGGRLPQLGQVVRQGDILAVVETPIIAADRATLAEKVGDIEQQTALAEARLARARRLLATGAGTTVAVSDAELEVEGLRRRREAVREIRSAPEVLRAPVDGMVATSRVVAGQVVAAQDILFQVVDPKSLYVEAVVFHDSDMPSLGAGEASATTTDGTQLRLRYQGTSRAMQQQSVTVQFAVLDPPPNLSVGQPVTVVAPSGKPEHGIVLPRDAVVRGGNGETLVWRHAEPERFQPRLVRAEPFDAGRVIVRAGVAEGERVVVRGADLVNQIR
ncbi:efflux RND transporter periplasmic adaptor subunit [Enterovirga sp. CN4-39]|uniref:efflux RND transporter periplasmic adaptor subunit n=1 Tax=Enterovirga sp. CN4-39 TaxID=3400910 RepID=UPI003C0BB5BC